MNNLRHALAEADEAQDACEAGINLALLAKAIAANPFDWPPGSDKIVDGWKKLRSWEMAGGVTT